MNRLLLLTVGVLALGVLAMANPPYPDPTPPPTGWGHDCSEWVVYDCPWGPYEMLWDPILNEWFLCPDGELAEFPPLDIELWIELECVFWWEYCEADMHLCSYYDDMCVFYNGTSSCNSEVNIVVVPPAGEDLAHLPFVHDINGNDNGEPDLGCAWTYSLDGSDFQPLLEGPDGSLYFTVDACNHYFTIQCCLDLLFHQADGYYAHGDGGYVCAVEPF